jgi:hypothetical protein
MGIGVAQIAVVGVAVLVATPDATRLPPGGRAVPPLAVLVGWSFVAAGAYAWLRRPDNPTGALMAAFGIAAQVSVLSVSDAPLPYLLAAFADPLRRRYSSTC